MSELAFLGALLGAAAGAGVVGALLGLGGGILLVPILTIFFGVSLPYAMGASIVSVIATSCGAAAGHLRSGLANVRLGLFLALATVTGALAGALLVGVVPERLLEILFGLALSYSAVATLRQLHVEVPPPLADDPLALRFGLAGSYHDRRLGCDVAYRAVCVRRGAIAMFFAGVLSGLLGIGSGAFKVLAMDTFMRLPMKVSTATSNFMIGITAAASAGVYFGRGDIHPVIVTPVAVGVLAGSYAGTRLITRLRNVTVRRLFLPVVLYLAVSMLARGLGVWP
ncbi:MAG TPA: sulfite exporter TauE/SafE family protein [Methylomirabilota bacterium]|jgi:hypothetical protein|nr:sulfite exporter TauE/SafE family protein [Methylomirabilota bacterium]